MKSLILTSLLITQSLIANAITQESLDDLSLEELMDIKIYSATKSYQRIEEIPANITVMTRKDIEKYNYTTLDELLKHVPGLFIIDDTEHFQIGSRGSLGSSFKLMINNNPISPLRIPTGSSSNRNFFATPVESIDRIEIIKGPQAVTYGSNSMYGSINIITNDFNEKNIISVSKGNNGQEKVFARVNHKYDDGGFVLNTSFYNTNGISGNLKDALGTDNFNDHSTQITDLEDKLENQYKTLDFSNTYKNLSTNIIISETNYGMYTVPTYRDGNKVKQVEKSLSFTYEDEINEVLAYKANFITSKKDYSISDIATKDFIIYGNSNYAEDKRDQLDLHLNYKVNDNYKLLIGTTYQKIKETANQTSEKYKAYQSHNYKFDEMDFYSKLQYKLNKLELNIGIRYNNKNDFKIQRSAKNLINNLNLQAEPISANNKGKYLPELSAIYHINSNNHLKFLYGKANQLTYARVDELEEITSSEINYIYLSKYYQINSSIFYNEAKNISLFTQTGSNIPNPPIGDKTTKGFEFAIIHKFNYNFETISSITIQDTKNDTNTSSSNYSPDFSPSFLGKIQLSYLKNDTRYSLLVDYISSMKASVDLTKKERYGKDSNDNINLSTNINHKFNENLSLNFHITNLLDRDNRIPAGSTLTNFRNGAYTKGREFLFTLKYNF